MMRTRLLLLAGCLVTVIARADLSYPIVDTGQTKCYDHRTAITAPAPGQPFYGQDVQFTGRAPSYTLGAKGLTVHDNVTGLTWQRSPDRNGDGVLTFSDKLTLAQARALPAGLNAQRFAGYDDWRLPTVKELYSLILFSGVDAGPNTTVTEAMSPFIDTRFFQFAYGDLSAGERIIDSQWATSTTYVANPNQMFGVNFADGRIKGYGTSMPGRGEKTFFVLCVRGNPGYGKNDFHDNGDGTISDRATGLMWAQADSGTGMNWEAALAWAQARNAEKYLGYRDWRLPNAKELQSMVDYTRAPDTSHTAAIDPLFRCTPITNEIGQRDYPFYWTSTTHASVMGGSAAVYLAFGRASGWPTGMGTGAPGRVGPPPGGGTPRFADVHGAGAQRSDPKTGDPASYPHGRGPQGDVVRINNYVRLVRGGEA